MRRIEAIGVGSVLPPNLLRSFLKDQRSTIFPTARQTERIDQAAMALSQDTIVGIVDNDPFATEYPSALADFSGSYRQPLPQSVLEHLRRLRRRNRT